jgi:CRISPR/Cas system-associated protein Csm6
VVYSPHSDFLRPVCLPPQVRLAPQIKKLRVVRQQFAELESEHAGRKQQYDAAMSQYESRVSTLENEVSGEPAC